MRVKWTDNIFAEPNRFYRKEYNADSSVTALLTPDNECELWVDQEHTSQVTLDKTNYGRIMRGTVGQWESLLGARLTVVDKDGNPIPPEKPPKPPETPKTPKIDRELRLTVASRVLQGFAANPEVFGKGKHRWQLKDGTETELIQYALGLVDELVKQTEGVA